MNILGWRREKSNYQVEYLEGFQHILKRVRAIVGQFGFFLTYF